MSLDKRRDEARRAFEKAKAARSVATQSKAQEPTRPPDKLVLKHPPPTPKQLGMTSQGLTPSAPPSPPKNDLKKAFEDRKRALSERSISKDFNRER